MKPVHKKAIMIAVAAVVIASISIGVFLMIPRQGFSVVLNPIDPADCGVNEWLEDFQYLYDFIEKNYPYLSVKERTYGIDWLDLKEMFEDRISNAQDNEEFLEIIASAMIALQNGHTWVMPPDQVISYASSTADWYPMNVIFSEVVTQAAGYWSSLYNNYASNRWGRVYNALIAYDRGNYLVQNYNTTWESQYGNNTIVTHVNGIDIDEAIQTCYDTARFDYDFNRTKIYLKGVYPHAFGDNAIFTIRNSTGYIGNVTLSVVAGNAGIPYEYPSSVVEFETYESDSIAYMYVGSFATERVEQYYDDVLAFYEQIENYDHLIIDIRGNTGGTYQVWIDGIVQPLIQDQIVHTQHLAYRTDFYITQLHASYLTDLVPKDQFSYLPPEVLTDEFQIYRNTMTYNPMGELNFNGEISLLTDNVVYSAAEGFANFCSEYDFASIYGTTTGGDGIMIFPMFFVLPNSKLVINSASALGLDATGHANEEVRTQPDVYYESAYGNWTELIDFTIADLLSG